MASSQSLDQLVPDVVSKQLEGKRFLWGSKGGFTAGKSGQTGMGAFYVVMIISSDERRAGDVAHLTSVRLLTLFVAVCL